MVVEKTIICLSTIGFNMSQALPKEKYNEILKVLSTLSNKDVLSEFKHHKLLRELKSIGIKSDSINELEMLIHFYGNKQDEVAASAIKLIKSTTENLNFFHNITTVLTGFFEIDLIIQYLENIELVSGDTINSEVISNAILFYYINGNLSRVFEKFGDFFSESDLIRFNKLCSVRDYLGLNTDDFQKIQNVIAKVIRERNLRIIHIDHTHVENDNLFEIIVPLNIKETIELNDFLFEIIYESNLTAIQNALTYCFSPIDV